MRRFASLVLAVVLVFSAAVVWAQLPTAPPEQVGLSSARLGRLGTVFKTEIEQDKLPGAVVVVARKGKIAFFESFGHRDKASGARMTNDTIFRIYSMTKPLVSVAAMMLMEEGRLQLTDPVSKFLPELSKLQVSIAKVDPEFARVTFATAPAEREMTDSGFFVPSDRLGRIAQPDPGNSIKLIDVTTPPKNDSGGAGGVSTAGDYLRFGQALLNGGQLDGARILSRSTVSLMTSDHLGRISAPTTPGELLLGTRGYTFGLGFAVREAPGVAGLPGSAGEYMWAGFAGTYFWVDPKEELVGVLMTQAPSATRAYYRRLLKQLVYQAIVD